MTCEARARWRATWRPPRCRPIRRRSWCWGSSRGSRPPISPSSASRTSSATGWCGRAVAREGPPMSSPRPPASASATSSCMPTMASAASTASPRSRRSARRTTAWRSAMPAATSSICRWRTSSCCRATGRPTGWRSWTGSAAWRGRRARRASSSAFARSPPTSSRSPRCASCGRPRSWARRMGRTRSSPPASPTRRPRSRPPASTPCSRIWPRASRWTGWCAATSASARRRWG